MYITAYSLAMACIWTSALAGIMCAIQKSKRTVQYFGLNNMIILYTFCIARMAAPIELPAARVVEVKGLYNAITQLCTRIIIGDTVLTGHVLLFIWGCGTVVKMFLLVKDYWSAECMARSCSVQSGSAAWEILKCLQEEKGDARKIPIYTTPLSIPMEMGILHPAIFLPNQEYTRQDLYYIVKHEYIHILNHDTTVKLLLNLWSCIFWWNPVTYLLCTNVEHTLELKCDLTIAGEIGEEGKSEYLSAILHVIQNTEEVKAQKHLPGNVNALYKTYRQSETLKRFRCVSECPKRTKKMRIKYRIYTAAIIAASILAFCMSYSFVLQSRFDVPKDELFDGGIVYVLEPETAYLRQKGEKYEIIYENQCVKIIDEDIALQMQQDGFEIR